MLRDSAERAQSKKDLELEMERVREGEGEGEREMEMEHQSKIIDIQESENMKMQIVMVREEDFDKQHFNDYGADSKIVAKIPYVSVVAPADVQPTVGINSRREPLKRTAKRGPQQMSPYTNPNIRRRKPVRLAFDPLRPYPHEWEEELNLFLNSSHEQFKEYEICSAGKEFFRTILDEKMWFEDKHIDIMLFFIMQRKMMHPKIFSQRCCIIPCVFNLYIRERFPLYEANSTDPSFWDSGNTLLKYVNGIKKKPKRQPWSELDKVYFPVNYNNEHWFAVEVDLVGRKIKTYDSLIKHIRPLPFSNFIKPFAILIPQLMIRAEFLNQNEASPWPVERVDVPQQSNGSDCGMYTVKFIELLSSDLPVDMLQYKDMTFYRKKAAIETFKDEWLC